MVYYQGEYAVATSSVTVTAGSTTSKSISGSVQTGTTVFKIGDWDGKYVSFSHTSPEPKRYTNLRLDQPVS
jgi:rhamnogalacturonan endolyase